MGRGLAVNARQQVRRDALEMFVVQTLEPRDVAVRFSDIHAS